MSELPASIRSVADTVGDLCHSSMHRCATLLDGKTKPRKSLGRLETLAIRLAGIQSSPTPRLRYPAVLVMAADHGVVANDVSAYPQQVTAQMLANFARAGAAINVLAKCSGAQLHVVNMGVRARLEESANIVDRSIAAGTKDFATEPAMTNVQATAAVEAGMQEAAALFEAGVDVLVLGEMGIGNSSAAAAITASLLQVASSVVCGRGTGIDDAQLLRKRTAIDRALRRTEMQAPPSAWNTLCEVGGFEIAGLVGAVIQAASRRVPVVVDGVITAAAALLAVRLVPRVADFLIAGHLSVEPAHRLILDELQLRPLLDLEMRLGEGSGATLAIPILRAACAIVSEMASFEQANVTDTGR